MAEAKSVTRHRKQKEKMEKTTPAAVTKQEEKSIFNKVLEYSKGHKLVCMNDKGVLMFGYRPDSEKADEVRNILLKEFGRDLEDGTRMIPFSYGFNVNCKKYEE